MPLSSPYIHLPGFADYLRTQRLTAFATMQLQINEDLNLPLNDLKTQTNEERLRLMQCELDEFLSYLAQNNPIQGIHLSLQKWIENQPGKEDTPSPNIALATYLRKKSFLFFLPDYCTSITQAIELIKEIDAFLFACEMETSAFQNTLQLKKSNASLEEFAYVASHDLKEPLRKISAFGDRLMSTHAEKLSSEGKMYLNKIVDAAQRMQVMINDLLSISMIMGNHSFELYSLQKILDETLQTLEYKIEQQNASIQYNTLPEARIIPSQFRQLFQNLLSNSLKFVREGSLPVIHIRYSLLTKNKNIPYLEAPATHYHKIEFSDNGIGFENEFAEKIFAIFQRLYGRNEYEGSGIGLAICKKIVEHHGGMISATGSPNIGSTFTIILPA